MQTMLEYRKAKYGNPVPAAKLIWAGNETKEFINYFPQWVVNQEVAKINKEFVASDDLLSTYNELSRSEYSWKELQCKPLPHGVDPALIETYLSNTLFQEKFKMTKEEYKACPRWKQIDMKKRYWPVLNKINTSFEIIVAHPDCQKEIICLRSNQSLAVVKAAVPMQTMFKLSWLPHRLT